ncbi:MAG TPA: AAA family ATPase [Clostridiales bacterium]|nr:AAA family ATPase [Clostridiales bacterium]
MEKLNIVVLSTDLDLRIQVKNSINSERMVIAGFADFNDAGLIKLSGLYPDVIIVAVKGPVEDHVFNFVQHVLSTVQNCFALLMNDRIDVDLVNKAAQYGFRRVLTLDTQPAELEDIISKIYSLELERNMDKNASKRVRSKVISVFSGKGGTGKTTVAINLAAALSKAGKRVFLIDADLQFGDVALAMDIEPKDTIVELVQDRNGVTIENINSFSIVHNTGVTVLCGPDSPEFAEYITGEDIERIIDIARPYFEYIIVDLPPSFNDYSIAALENSNDILMVYNNDILSLRNAKTCITILEKLHLKDKVEIVINKNLQGLISVRDFEKMFNMSVIASVPHDVKAATACINKGLPIFVAHSKSLISKEIGNLANKIIQKHTGILPIDMQPKKRFSLFKKA